MPTANRRCSSLRACAAALVAAGALLAGCATVPPPEPSAPRPAAPVPETPAAPRPPPAAATPDGVQRGKLSLYGAAHAGKPTASGAGFDPAALTMAHRTLPFGTRVRVTNLENSRSVVVVVNDRGPFVQGRIADLSEAAARQIGMVSDGVVDGQLEIVPAAR